MGGSSSQTVLCLLYGHGLLDDFCPDVPRWPIRHK